MSSPTSTALPADRVAALIASAREARDHAYAPYSTFRVGAALLGASGRIHLAANVESASYGLTVCAERNAVARAVFDGEREFAALAIVADCDPIASPCGACRQVLSEFCGASMPVVMANLKDAPRVEPLGFLLPHAFSRGPRNPADSRRPSDRGGGACA